MSTIDEIRERLLVVPTLFTGVHGAASLALVKDDSKPAGRAPVGFVLMAREAAAENERATGRVLQRLERDVVVLFYAEHLGDRHGGAASDEIEAIKAFVRGRLVGWQTTDMDEPITFVGSEVVEARGGGGGVEETFAAPTYLQETT